MVDYITPTQHPLPNASVVEKGEPMFPTHVILAAKRYTDMVKGQPEHWMTLDDAFDSIYTEMGWK